MTDSALVATLDLAETAGDDVRNAIAQRALHVLIPYAVFSRLTVPQRWWIGSLSQDRARRVLDCEPCVARIADAVAPWVCAACGRRWLEP